jgi:hypothetical protein
MSLRVPAISTFLTVLVGQMSFGRMFFDPMVRCLFLLLSLQFFYPDKFLEKKGFEWKFAKLLTTALKLSVSGNSMLLLFSYLCQEKLTL